MLLTMESLVKRGSVSEEMVKIWLAGLGSRKCILVKGSRNG
jgi:hypothetical protein